jgi:hypothetical protein
MINQDKIKELFEYNDGHLFWKHTRRNTTANKRAGSIDYDGYLQIGISNKKYREHRLIFCLFHGYFPKMIDHINGDKQDNRIENLRECNKSINALNVKKPSSRNTSGVIGVSPTKHGTWKAYYKGKTLGYFKTKIEAINTRKLSECVGGG